MDFTNNTPQPTTNDAPSRPLNITIVGAGIGGLSAAIFLRQQGHTVTLLEASRFANEVGAAVHLAPNANGLLRRIGLYPEEGGAVVPRRSTMMYADGTLIYDADFSEEANRWQHPWQLAHRVNFHNQLKKLATCGEGKGTPAVLRLRSRVVDVDPKAGVVTLESGEQVKSDLVVGADGVHSRTRYRLPGAESFKTFKTGDSLFRFMLPRQKVLDDPETRKFAEEDGHMYGAIGEGRRIIVYPTLDNTVLNCGLTFTEPEGETVEELGGSDWQNQGNKSRMLELCKEFSPDIIKLLSMADEDTLKVWSLLDMEQLPTWIHEKLVLIGDAAHPFTPHQGQGAAQAIEDAASLAVMLPADTPLSSIPARLKLYEKCRYERASFIQDYSRKPGKNILVDYNFGHDEWDYSTQALRKWEQANNQNLLWRTPTAFGPMPGFQGHSKDGSKATFQTASIKFKTSRTLLQNLLPDNLHFAAADTIAYATFTATQLGNLEWFGGRGYSHFGLYMHGIEHTQADGKTVTGTYIPILFENLSDTILSGRQDLGLPKVFADLEVQHDDDKWTLDASWMSSTFCTMKLSSLQEHDVTNDDVLPTLSPPLPKHEGLLFHKHVPATGGGGGGERVKADVDYTAFLPDTESSRTVDRKLVRRFKTDAASISFDALDWKALPTLHHIVERLKEIPVYEIVEAKVEQGTGVSDVSAIQRLE